MITNFVTVYPGHIDLPDYGREATPTLEHFMSTGAWFAGTPDELVARVKQMEERYPGMAHVNLSTPLTTPKSVMVDQLQWVSEAVMPYFRRLSF